jgi:hypothetical protein
MVSLNYLDQPSLLSWLELRKLTFDMGKQYKMRLEYDMGCFIILCLVEGILLILKAFNYLDWAPFISTYHWILLLIHFLVHVMFAVPALISAARSNEQTAAQIAHFVRLRLILQRVVRDGRVLQSNKPEDLLNRDIRKAMIYLNLQATAKLIKR